MVYLNFRLIQAIVEGCGLAKGEIGMASIDLKKPTLILSKVSYQNIMLQFIVVVFMESHSGQKW